MEEFIVILFDKRNFITLDSKKFNYVNYISAVLIKDEFLL
jgi:hypothetical protein